MVPFQEGLAYPSIDDLLECLREHRINTGINPELIEEMVLKHVLNRRVLVAEGVSPVSGANARFEILIDTSGQGKPQIDEDGRVDMRNLQLVINVDAQTPLIRKIPATAGTEGKSVYGEPVAARAGHDKQFPAGQGTCIVEDNPLILAAAVDGAVVVTHDGCVEVIKSEVISGDIDYTTGNVSFTGDLSITGTVRSGFSVNVKGNLRIGGNVEEASVTCTGNLDIAGGAIGAGQGLIVCGGSLRVRLVQRFTIKAGGDITITEDSIHAIVMAQGKITSRTIMSGTAYGGECVETEVAGAVAGTRTIIDAGGTIDVLGAKQELLEKIASFSTELSSIRKSQFDIVNQSMDSEGKIGALEEKTMGHLWQQRFEIEERVSKLRYEVSLIDERLDKRPQAYIKIGKALPNSMIRFGQRTKLIKSVLVKVVFKYEDEHIKITRY